jgi:hypothetical protein
LKSSSTDTSIADADIFGAAGVHLSIFLRALCRVSKSVQSSLHMIGMGDMTELWLNR